MRDLSIMYIIKNLANKDPAYPCYCKIAIDMGFEQIYDT